MGNLEQSFLCIQYQLKFSLPFINSEPRVYFERAKYIVDENADICHVTVKRAGSDLSKAASVVIRSKKTNPVSAKGTKKIYWVYKCLGI